MNLSLCTYGLPCINSCFRKFILRYFYSATNRGNLYAFTTTCDTPVCHDYNGPLYDTSASFQVANSTDILLPLDFSNQADAIEILDSSTGVIGRDTVAIGGLTIHNQTIGAVQNATGDALWNGTAGVLGLSFPARDRYACYIALTNT